MPKGYVQTILSKVVGDRKPVEKPDPTPLQPPLGYKKQPSLTEQIQQMVRNEHLQRELARRGAETFEEADDFDVGDDFDPMSPYEEVFDPELGGSLAPEFARNVVRKWEQEKAAKKAAEDAGKPTGKPSPGPVPPQPPTSKPPSDGPADD